MKVKLLKLVRKRFKIVYLPEGYVDYFGEFKPGPYVRLVDKSKTYHSHKKVDEYHSINSRVNEFKSDILVTLKNSYFKYSNKSSKITEEVLWYKKNK